MAPAAMTPVAMVAPVVGPVSNTLFVYGSLLSKYVPRDENAIVPPPTLRSARKLGAATLQGYTLCDLGRYPGIVQAQGRDDTVHGEVYLLENGTANWEVLDKYEGISEEEQKPYEYRRETVKVNIDGKGERLVQTYVYNRDDAHKKHRIAGGDFVAYYNKQTAEKKRKAAMAVPVTGPVSNTLFVYGSLLSKYVPRDENAIVPPPTLRSARMLGAATLQGYTLCDLGRYPGIVQAQGRDDTVHGEVYLLADETANWEVLDKYEGISEEEQKPYEYRRETVKVKVDGKGELLVQTYVYNRDDAHKKHRIAGGNFVAYYNKQTVAKKALEKTPSLV